MIWKSAGFFKAIPQTVFYLPVEAAHFVRRPSLKGVQQFRVHAEQEWLALGHIVSIIKSACVYDRLGRSF